MAMDRRLKTGLAATASVVAVVAGLGALAVVAMTYPPIATPVVRTAIAMATGKPTQLQRAQLHLRWPLGFEMRGLNIAADAAPIRMASIDGRLNPFGFLPRVSFLPLVQTRDGDLAATVGGSEGGGPPGWLTEIDRLEADSIRITLRREDVGRSDLFIVDSASGRLAGGDLRLTGRGGGAEVFFDGGLAGPFLNGLAGALTLRGDNLAQFADLLGLAAPDTPPYEWNARLSAGVNTWNLNGITGTVGDSDLSGDIEVTLGGARPFIDADLRSESLDFDDLGLFVGAPTQIGEGESANELQVATNAAFQASDRLIPDATLDLERIRAVDAEVDFVAASVRAGGFPLDAVSLHMTLNDAVMRFDPAEFTIAQGRLVIQAQIDASGDTVVSDLSGTVDGVQLGDMANGNIGTGELEGRFDLGVTGDNLRVAAASANGAAAIWAQDAAIRKLAEEAADLDVGEALLVLIGEDSQNPEMEALRCGVIRFNVEQGVARAEPIVFDSADTTLLVEGHVDFRDETIDISIDANNKDISWGQLLGDVNIQGTMRSPRIAPDLTPAIVQGGLAVLLAGVAGPLAALPFINLPDTSGDAPCGELMAAAQAAPGAATAIPAERILGEDAAERRAERDEPAPAPADPEAEAARQNVREGAERGLTTPVDPRRP